jgi:hypothetical protein
MPTWMMTGTQPCITATFMRPPQPQPEAARQNLLLDSICW